MSRMKLVSVATLLLLAGLAVAQEETTATKPIPDTEIGLSKTSVFDVAAPDAVTDEMSEPGEEPAVARSHEESPPLIPHGIADFLPLTLDSNVCIECHGIAGREEGDPTPIPESHYVDLRHAPEKVTDAVVGARYNCLSCHVAQTDAEPLVGNEFASQP